jgi:hypothetical protein
MRRGLIEALRQHSIDVLSARAAGMTNRGDEEHLRRAASEGRVLYSSNIAHFLQIHTEWVSSQQSHAGIILAHQKRWSIGEQLRRLLHLMSILGAEEMRNRVEFLTRW